MAGQLFNHTTTTL